jgi:hypothetical protein
MVWMAETARPLVMGHGPRHASTLRGFSNHQRASPCCCPQDRYTCRHVVRLQNM